MGSALALALLVTVLVPSFGQTVQAADKPFIHTIIQDVFEGEVSDIFSPTFRVIPRGQSQELQFKVSTIVDITPGSPVPADYKVNLVDHETKQIIETQTTDANGMVTFSPMTEERINEICHREPCEYRDAYLPSTSYYGFLQEDGGYNRKVTVYRLRLEMDHQEIGENIYQGGTYIATRASFSFKDTKVCTLEVQPMMLDYGANFNPMDLVTKVGIDWQGKLSEKSSQDLAPNWTKFTFVNPDGKTVDTIDTTKPGVYQVTVQVFPFGTDKYGWCWDTQTTTVTVNPDTPDLQKDYVLTFDPNGGNWDDDTTERTFRVQLGQSFEIIEAPVKEGAKFLYWKGSEYQPGDSYVVEGDHTFTAEWASNDIPYIEIPVYPNQTVTGPVVEQLEPLPQPTGQVVVPSAGPSPSVYDLPATGSVETSLTVWGGLGLVLAGLLLKKRG